MRYDEVARRQQHECTKKDKEDEKAFMLRIVSVAGPKQNAQIATRLAAIVATGTFTQDRRGAAVLKDGSVAANKNNNGSFSYISRLCTHVIHCKATPTSHIFLLLGGKPEGFGYFQ
jgi:hypothetical protein